jgi:transposase-like protein
MHAESVTQLPEIRELGLCRGMVDASPMPMPRAARAPHSSKVPEACPHCGSHVLTRRGTRKKKLEIVQLWRCASCKKTFTPGPAAIRGKTYPLRMVLNALSTYSLGYSLSDTAARMQSKTGRTISASTIECWLRQHKPLMSYLRLRDRGRLLFRPEQTIRSIKLYHRQVYGYAFHRPKLEFLRRGELDDKRSGDTRFAAVANFLEAVPLICPHDLFRTEDRARASQAQPAFADICRVIVTRKEIVATRIAELIIPAVGNNKLRHETLQRFMLINDSVTVAIEIPIWLREADIATLERQHGIELAPRVGAAERTVTGHIDFLQVRNGCVHILDYKPDARTNRPIAQLAIYALALTRLVPGLKLFDIKCAWFNEEEYCEFYPRTLFVRPQLAVGKTSSKLQKTDG